MVNHIDGSQEQVTVRQLHVNEYPLYQVSMENEPLMVDLLCSKLSPKNEPTGWSLTLTLESFEAVVETGDRINADFFGRWLARDLRRKKVLLDGLGDRAVAALTEAASAVAASPSRILSPRLPSN